MSNLHELMHRFLGRKRHPAKTETSVNPAEEMITVVVDPTQKKDATSKDATSVDLGNLGTFEHQLGGTVIYRSPDNPNPRVKAVLVEGRLPTIGVKSG